MDPQKEPSKYKILKRIKNLNFELVTSRSTAIVLDIIFYATEQMRHDPSHKRNAPCCWPPQLDPSRIPAAFTLLSLRRVCMEVERSH